MKDKRSSRTRTIARLRGLYRKTDDPDFAVAADCLERAEDAKVTAAVCCAFAVLFIAISRAAPLDGPLRDVSIAIVACTAAIGIYSVLQVRSNLDVAERCIEEAEERYRL